MGLTCRNVMQLQDAFLDGNLSSSLIAEVHAHLLQCPPCQQQFEMIRASVDVIALDRSEPTLDSGFASRVVASLPMVASPVESRVASRRQRHRRTFRLFAAGILPAAAAALFFAVLIWPTPEHQSIRSSVAGEAIWAPELLNDWMGSSISAVSDTRRAAEDLNQLVGLSVEGAGFGLPKNPSSLDAAATMATATDWSAVDVLLRPFDELIRPADSSAKAADGIVRF